MRQGIQRPKLPAASQNLQPSNTDRSLNHPLDLDSDFNPQPPCCRDKSSAPSGLLPPSVPPPSAPPRSGPLLLLPRATSSRPLPSLASTAPMPLLWYADSRNDEGQEKKGGRLLFVCFECLEKPIAHLLRTQRPQTYHESTRTNHVQHGYKTANIMVLFFASISSTPQPPRRRPSTPPPKSSPSWPASSRRTPSWSASCPRRR